MAIKFSLKRISTPIKELSKSGYLVKICKKIIFKHLHLKNMKNTTYNKATNEKEDDRPNKEN